MEQKKEFASFQWEVSRKKRGEAGRPRQLRLVAVAGLVSLKT
jgi:hypothetical protein